MEIELIDKLTKSQEDHLFQWRDRVFPAEGKTINWAKLSWHLLAFDESMYPLAHLGYADFTISCDGQHQEKVIGVGGMVVRPEWQGQHVPSQLFNFLHESDHARGLSETFTLFCPKRLEGYYQKHGYSRFRGELTFLQRGIKTTTDSFIFMQAGAPLIANDIHISGEPW